MAENMAKEQARNRVIAAISWNIFETTVLQDKLPGLELRLREWIAETHSNRVDDAWLEV